MASKPRAVGRPLRHPCQWQIVSLFQLAQTFMLVSYTPSTLGSFSCVTQCLYNVPLASSFVCTVEILHIGVPTCPNLHIKTKQYSSLYICKQQHNLFIFGWNMYEYKAFSYLYHLGKPLSARHEARMFYIWTFQRQCRRPSPMPLRLHCVHMLQTGCAMLLQGFREGTGSPTSFTCDKLVGAFAKWLMSL